MKVFRPLNRTEWSNYLKIYVTAVVCTVAFTIYKMKRKQNRFEKKVYLLLKFTPPANTNYYYCLSDEWTGDGDMVQLDHDGIMIYHELLNKIAAMNDYLDTIDVERALVEDVVTVCARVDDETPVVGIGAVVDDIIFRLFDPEKLANPVTEPFLVYEMLSARTVNDELYTGSLSLPSTAIVRNNLSRRPESEGIPSDHILGSHPSKDRINVRELRELPYLSEQRFKKSLKETRWVEPTDVPFDGHYMGRHLEFVVSDGMILWINGDERRPELVFPFPLIPRYREFLSLCRRVLNGTHKDGKMQITDEEEYWEYVTGIGKNGEGRPQFPKGTVLVGRMQAYHRSMMLAYYKKEASRHFNKIKNLLKLPHRIPGKVPPESANKRARKWTKVIEKQFVKAAVETNMSIAFSDKEKKGAKRQAQRLSSIEHEMMRMRPEWKNFSVFRPTSWIPSLTMEIPGVTQDQIERVVNLASSEEVKNVVEKVNSPEVENILKTGSMVSTMTKEVMEAPKRMMDEFTRICEELNIKDLMVNFYGKIMNFFAFMLQPDIPMHAKASFVAQCIPGTLGNWTSIATAVAMYYTKEKDIEHEMKEDEKGVLTGIWTVVKSLCGKADIGDLSQRELLTFRNLHSGLTVMKDISSIAKNLKDMVEWIMRKMWYVATNEHLFPWESDSMYSQIMSWAKFCERYTTSENLHALDYETYVKQFEEVFRPLQRTMVLQKEQKWRSFFSKIENDSNDIYRRAKRYLSHPGARKMPVAVLLMGPTAIGKSLVTTLIARNVAKMLKIHYTDASELTYYRNKMEEFWSGYFSQPTCIMDEFLCQLDDKWLMNEGVEILRVVNEAPYGIPMAALEEKGRNFQSDLVICTTNMGADEGRVKILIDGTDYGSCPPTISLPAALTKNMTSSKAIMGRFKNFMYFVELRQVLATGEVKQDKKSLNSAWYFHPYEMVQENTHLDGRERPVLLRRVKNGDVYAKPFVMSQILGMIQRAYQTREDAMIEVIKHWPGLDELYMIEHQSGREDKIPDLDRESGFSEGRDSKPSFLPPVDEVEEFDVEETKLFEDDDEITELTVPSDDGPRGKPDVTRDDVRWLVDNFIGVSPRPVIDQIDQMIRGFETPLCEVVEVIKERIAALKGEYNTFSEIPKVSWRLTGGVSEMETLEALVKLAEILDRTGIEWIKKHHVDALDYLKIWKIDAAWFLAYLNVTCIGTGKHTWTDKHMYWFKHKLKQLLFKTMTTSMKYVEKALFWLRKCKNRVANSFEDFNEMLHKYPLMIPLVFPIVSFLMFQIMTTVMMIIWKLTGLAKTNKKRKKTVLLPVNKEATPGGYPPGATDSTRRIRKPVRIQKGRIQRVTLQEGETPISDQEPKNKNMFILKIEGPSALVQLWGMFITGRFAVVPAHIFTRFFMVGEEKLTIDPRRLDDLITITTADGSCQFRAFEIIDDLRMDPEREIAFVDFRRVSRTSPERARILCERPKIVHHFIKVRDLSNRMHFWEGLYMLRYYVEAGKVSLRTRMHPVTGTGTFNLDIPDVTERARKEDEEKGLKPMDESLLESEPFAYPDPLGNEGYPPLMSVSSVDLGYSSVGDCGLPYMMPHAPRGIMGFHVAKKTGTMERLVRLITQEEIASFLESFGEVDDETITGVEPNEEQKKTERALAECGDRVIHEGFGEYTQVPGKSNLRQTWLHPEHNRESMRLFGPSKVTTAPMRVYVNDDGVEVSPFRQGLQEMKPLVNTVTEVEAKFAFHNLHRQWSPVGAGRPYICTMKEAILGIPGIDGYSAMEKDTACGYTYKTKYKKFGDLSQSGKHRFIKFGDDDFEFVRNEYGFSPVEFEYARALYAMMHGKPCYPIFEDIGKDEKISLEKARAGRLRIFSVGPLHWLIILKQVYDCLIATATKRRNSSDAKIGLKQRSDDWYAFYYHLKRHPNLLDADFKFWDKNQILVVMETAFHEIKMWYHSFKSRDLILSLRRFIDDAIVLFAKFRMPITDELRRDPMEILDDIHDSVAKDTIYSVHTAMGVVYVAIAIISSGHLLTAFLGSLMNMGYQRIAFYRHCPDKIFEQHVALGVNGDDNIMSISNDVVEKHNGITLQKTFATMGLTYTDSAKTGVMSALTSFATAEFNKRRFIPDGPRLRVPLRFKTIVEILYWRTKKLNSVAAIKESILSVNIELKEYTREEHDSFFRKLSLAMVPLADRGVDVSKLLEKLTPYDTWIMYRSESILCSEERPETFSGQQVMPVSRSLKQKSEPLPVQLEALNMQYTSLMENVSFTDTTATVSATETIISNSLSGSSGRIVHKDPDLERIYDIDTIVWTSAYTVGNCLACYRFPDALLAPTAVWNRLQHRKFVRAGVKVMIRANSSIFHYGTLMISWLPFYDPTNVTNARSSADDEYVAKMGNLYAMSGNPSILMAANTQETIELTIPYRAPYPWLDLDRVWGGNLNPASIGCVVVRVLDPLSCSGQASTAIDLVVSAQFVDLEWTVTTNKARAAIAPTVNMAAFIVNESMVQEREQKSESGLLSSIAESTQRTLKHFETIPLVGQYVSGARRILKFVSGTSKALGLNRPTTDSAVQMITQRVGGDMNFVNGLETAQKLSLRSDYMSSNDQSVMGLAGDETQLKHLASRLTLLTTFSFTGATAPGVLRQISVTPALAHFRTVTVLTNNYNVANPGHGAYLSRLFRHWRGSMKYMVNICAPSTTSARMRISWSPDVFSVAGNTGELYTEMIDICGSTTHCFTVPYASADAWKMCGFLLDESAAHPDYYSNGHVSFYLVNPPSSATTDSSIRISVFTTIGEDMQFSKAVVPNRDALSRIHLSPSSLQARRVEKDDFELEMRFSERGSSFLYGCGPFPSLGTGFGNVDNGVCMSSEFQDLRELLHRYTYMQSSNTTGGTPFTDQSGGHEIIESISTNVGAANVTCLIPFMYLFLKGSWRLKIHSNKEELFWASEVDQTGTNLLNSNYLVTVPHGWSGTAVMSGKTGGDLTVEIPWYCRWTHALPRCSISGAQSDGGYLLKRKVLITAPSDGATYYAWEAYGDDVVLGFLCAPPGVWGKPELATICTPGTFPV